MEKAPFIGQLDRKIQVVRIIATRNDVGEEVPNDETIASPYSYMQDTAGGEDVEGKVRRSVSRSYTIRYNPAIKAEGNKAVVIDGSDRFNVYHVKEIGRRRHLELLVNLYE